MGKRFTKGMLLGGLFGAGLMWMHTTKRGRRFKVTMMEHANTVTKEVLRRIPENEWVDGKKVESVLDDVVREYGAAKDLASAATHLLKKEVKKHIKTRGAKRR